MSNLEKEKKENLELNHFIKLIKQVRCNDG